jgi:hypothetical protein
MTPAASRLWGHFFIFRLSLLTSVPGELFFGLRPFSEVMVFWWVVSGRPSERSVKPERKRVAEKGQCFAVCFLSARAVA